MTSAISIEDVSKQYRLGQVGTGTISHDLNRWWAKIRGKEDPYLRVTAVNDRTKPQSLNTDTKGLPSSEYVWALKDISLQIPEGEIVGIIGNNGAGKSTLLKILSRVTAPTTGQVRIRGRVASLLEVGTGFHPELTGRDNIFLNGVILGMSRGEIRRHFDEIVDFSGCAKYIDTPVKRYSSGMYVRLAFAVAAHLDVEIMIVDEVLAVGDADFQSRCIGKMQDVSRATGRTVLFVSHNMSAVRTLCTSGVYLANGSVVTSGPVEKIINAYYGGSQTGEFRGVVSAKMVRQYATNHARIRLVQLLDEDGVMTRCLDPHKPLTVQVSFEVLEPVDAGLVEVAVCDAKGVQLTQSLSSWELGTIPLETGCYQIAVDLDLDLLPGTYSILAGLHMSDGTTIDFVERSLDFEAINPPKESVFHYPWPVRGPIRPKSRWQSPVRIAETLISELDATVKEVRVVENPNCLLAN